MDIYSYDRIANHEESLAVPKRRRGRPTGSLVEGLLKKRKTESPSSDDAWGVDAEGYQSTIPGVYFHVPKKEWRAVIGRGSRRHQKTFSVRKYGFLEAKRNAEFYRTQFNELGSGSDGRRTGDQQQDLSLHNNTAAYEEVNRAIEDLFQSCLETIEPQLTASQHPMSTDGQYLNYFLLVAMSQLVANLIAALLAHTGE